MPYLSLPNFSYDSGPRRIQSGPDHEGYVVLYSGVQSTGPDEGIVVAGAPLSGTITQGAWDYDANWRYVPSTLQTQSGGLDPTPYNVSGALDTYDGVRIYTRNTVAGAQIASAIGPQPGSTVNRPEKYMYFGGAAPDNQNYSPYNTPEINLAAEGKTGGGVTHKTFESSLLTNVLGSQGTSDRSQWRYHQPVYCKTYTETKRSEVPGLMSTPLRAVYRGGSTSYSYNYGGELAANRGGFELLPSDYPPTSVPGSGTITYPDPLFVGDTISGFASCAGGLISWYRVDTSTGNRSLITQGSSSYTTVLGDVGFAIEAEVQCPDPFSPTGFGTSGSAGITSVIQPPFDPTIYTFFRWNGSVTYARTFTPTPVTQSITSSWFSVSFYQHGQIEIYPTLFDGTPYFPIYPKLIPYPGPLPPWSSSFSVSFNMTNATQEYNPFCNATNFFGPMARISSASGIVLLSFPTTQVYSTCYEPTPIETSDFFMSAAGVWEFSNDGSTVLTTWDGT